MAKHAEKYFHTEMDKDAGLQHTFHKTKIVATVGPACDTYEKLLELVKSGVNVFRLNFSHGTHENKAEIIRHIRKLILEELRVRGHFLGYEANQGASRLELKFNRG